MASSAQRAQTQGAPLIDPYQTAVGTPQLIQCFNLMDVRLASIDDKLARIDGRLAGISNTLQAVREDQAAGFTALAGLLEEIRDRLPVEDGS